MEISVEMNSQAEFLDDASHVIEAVVAQFNNALVKFSVPKDTVIGGSVQWILECSEHDETAFCQAIKDQMTATRDDVSVSVQKTDQGDNAVLYVIAGQLSQHYAHNPDIDVSVMPHEAAQSLGFEIEEAKQADFNKMLAAQRALARMGRDSDNPDT